MGDAKQLEFVGFSSCINPSFWHKLAQLKLDVFKLDESATDIWGYFSNLNSHSKPVLEVDSTSFNKNYNGLKHTLPYHGLLINKNTIEQFKDCDKKDVLAITAKRIKNLLNSDAIENPSLLNYFLVLSYADLKKYNFFYWFAFLAHASFKPKVLNYCNISIVLDEEKQNYLYKEYALLSVNNKCFFVLNYKHLKVETLKEWKSSDCYDDYLFVFSDPSISKEHAGWPLRNFILFLLYHCKNIHGKKLKFLGLRLQTKGSEITCSESVIWEVLMQDIKDMDSEVSSSTLWLGYELNERGKMGPRLAKMKDSMSPTSLAESAVDLNLKLMKWRLLPDINLEIIKQSKCLLLGAGTLGCAVARNLLGWGVRQITFVDNGSVSYSNPVRQSLYTFEDCVSNKPKAVAAADNLKLIFPGVISAGYNFSIPMPGHPVGESLMQQTRESTEKLIGLIEEHDIIFLLMDSRESRWLPTLLGASSKKIVINAALGFDTYLVMRHGTRGNSKPKIIQPNNELKCILGDKLGCYFCNDITAPGDSLKDRTLDQQCTVTRPGVANVAGALAVELAVSLLQHEDGGLAPAFYATSRNADVSRDNECALGILPHSIRGFLSLFSHVLPGTERYNQCIACSDIVVEEYRNMGFDFLLQVFNTSKYLEELTGLSKIYLDNANLEEWDLSDTEENE